jgi:hypothetical protein
MPGSYDYYKEYCVCPLRQISIVMHTTADLETASYPVTVYNVNLSAIGTASTKAEYISIWNSDGANQAKGVLIGNYGPFSFILMALNGITPPAFVYGNYTGSPVNPYPVPNAGPDQTITTLSVTLSGSATDDGSIASYRWIKESGPAGDTIESPAAASTVVNGLTPGIYIFRLTVTDNLGATASDTVKITVNDTSVSNFAPTANAGSSITIYLPTNSVTLNGSGADIDGFIASYAWTKFSGGAATITSPASVNTTVTGLVAGVYVFRLTVTDNLGATGFSDVQVTVNAALVSFNTALTFVSSVTDTQAAVTGIVAAANATQKFEFNAIATQTGTPQRMDLFISGTQVMAVNFLSDHAGQSFAYTHTNGIQYTGNFANGAVTL